MNRLLSVRFLTEQAIDKFFYYPIYYILIE